MTKPTTPQRADHQADGTTDLAPLTILRTETVFSKLPVHNLAKRGSVNIHIAQTNDEGKLDLYWRVSPHPVFGEPRQLAYKLDTIVINRRIDDLGRPLPDLIYLGTLREIARELNLGNDTPAVKRALRQNAHTVIAVQLTYTDTQGVEHEVAFESTRYGVVFTGERLPDGRKADAVYIILNPPYRHVLNHAPTRPLDYNYLKVLPPAAQRCYEIISYKIFTALKYRHPYAKLLYSEYCTFSAQQRYADYNHVKKQMYKVHHPHRTSGYLRKVSYEATTDRDGQPDWVMRYVPGPKAIAAYQASNGDSTPLSAAAPRDADVGSGAALPPRDTPVTVTPHPAPALVASESTTASPEEGLRSLVVHFYTRLGTKASAQKLARDAAVAVQLLADGFSLADLIFATEWAVQHVPGVTSFGLLPHIMHHALQARHEAELAEDAKRAAAARLQAQRQHQQAEQARAPRLEAFRAALSEEAIATFRCQAVEGLAHEGYHERMVGYSMLLTIRLEDLIEQAFLRAGAPGEPAP
jgi:hypothetical protein